MNPPDTTDSQNDDCISGVSDPGPDERPSPVYGRRVTAIVVTYWTGPVLPDCIQALRDQSEIWEIIIIDNGNPASTREWLADLISGDPQLHLISPGRNTGFSAGCNLGAARATGDFLALVNPDCVLPPGTIARFLDVFQEDAKAWVCGGRLEHPDGTEQRGGRRQILSPWRAFIELLRFDRLFPDHPYFRRLHMHEETPIDEAREVPIVSGAFMLVPKRVYDRLGGLDDNMFLHFEDADLCIRIAQHGGKVLYCGHIPVAHHLSTSDVSKTFIEWHKTRSTSYYFYKHFNVSYPAWFLMLVSVLLWLRFVVLAPKLLIGDFPGMVRRLGRR